MTRALEPAEMARLHGELTDFALTHPEAYAELFLREAPLDSSRLPASLADLLTAAELVTIEGARATAEVRINHLPAFDVVVCTDLCTYAANDQVFPIHAEQLMMIDRSLVGEGDEVLELGVGSGVLSIVAARRGAAVTAVDINARALRYARFNCALNGVSDAVDLRESDWFAAVAGQRFDRLMSNPPFEPAPPGVEHFLHSSAGVDGMDVIRSFLESFETYLRPGGSLEIVTYSLVGPEQMLLAEIAAPLPGRKRFVYHPQRIALAEFMDKYDAPPSARADEALVLVVMSLELGASESATLTELGADEAARYPDVLRPVGYPGRGPTVPTSERALEISSVVMQAISTVVEEQFFHSLPEQVSKDTYFQDIGFDSVAYVSLISLLEEKVGYIPEELMESGSFPATIGEMTRVYDDAASARKSGA